MTTRSCHPWRAGLLAVILAASLPAALAAQPAPAPTPAVKPVFSPKHPTGMYAVGDTVAWTATLPAGTVARARRLRLQDSEEQPGGPRNGDARLLTGPVDHRRGGPRADDGLRGSHRAGLRGRLGRQARRRRGAVEADAVGAAAGRLRRVLERQAEGARRGPDRSGAHPDREPEPGRRAVHGDAAQPRLERARLSGQAEAPGPLSGPRHPAVGGRLQADAQGVGRSRRRGLADAEPQRARHAARRGQRSRRWPAATATSAPSIARRPIS